MNATSEAPFSTPGTPGDGVTSLFAIVNSLSRHLDADPRGAGLTAPHSSFTLSETLQHAAQSIEYALSGYPELKPAGVRHTIGRAVKHLFLHRGAMRHNLAAPVAGAPELDPEVAAARALTRLREAVTAFASHTGPLQPHPTYGVCSADQGARLQAMHLREHLPGLAAVTAA